MWFQVATFITIDFPTAIWGKVGRGQKTEEARQKEEEEGEKEEEKEQERKQWREFLRGWGSSQREENKRGQVIGQISLLWLWFDMLIYALQAMKREEEREKEVKRLMSVDERKRPYNVMYDLKAPDDDELEAYRRKRLRDEDPMAQFQSWTHCWHMRHADGILLHWHLMTGFIIISGFCVLFSVIFMAIMHEESYLIMTYHVWSKFDGYY